MDLRQWFLLNDLPLAMELTDVVRHIPCTKFRSPNVLDLFIAGYRCGFMLTDGDGFPTEALHRMVFMMPGVELCTGDDLPPEERRAFFKQDAPMDVLATTWFLRGITDRVKSANAVLSMNHWVDRYWLHDFLPRIDQQYITYTDPDDKRRRRTCYIATCPPAWELHDYVYEGFWRWNHDHHERVGAYGWVPAQTPNAYSILRQHPDLGAPAGEGSQCGGPEEHGSPTPTMLPPSLIGT
jgi:hypothetical protein